MRQGVLGEMLTLPATQLDHQLNVSRSKPSQCWVGCNRRAIAAGMVMSALPIIIGAVVVALGWPRQGPLPTVLRIVGGLMMVGGIYITFRLWRSLQTPRVARRGEFLLFDLRDGEPIAVPIQIVECFFMGQGPTPFDQEAFRKTESANIVVRLAERFEEWKRVEVKPSLARWCDGYITLHGMWCEPIDQDGMERLNDRLRQAHRQLRKEAADRVVNDA